MYRTSSVLALGLFLGLAPAGLNAQTQTQEPAAQQDTQQQQVQQDQQAQPDQQRAAGLLATDEQSLLVDTMIGSNVYSPDDEDIGSIDDVLITTDGEVGGVVIGVGGWLGVGQRDVLVQLEDLLLDTRDGEFRLVMQRTREELEAQPEFRRVDEQRDAAMMQQGTGQPPVTQPQTMQQQDQQAGVQQDTVQQDQQAYQQADQELEQASQSIEQGDAERARMSLNQAREYMQQAYEQAQPERQQALEQANEAMQQAEQAINEGQGQQAQQNVEQARDQLQVARQAMGQRDQQAGMQQDTTTEQQTTEQQMMTQQDTVVRERPRDGRIVFQDERSILASTMIGSNVRSAADEDLGSINDIIVSMDGQVEGVVIGVGGFLGIGEKDVVIAMDGLDIQRTGDEDVRVSVTQSREDIEAAPGFERPQRQGIQQ